MDAGVVHPRVDRARGARGRRLGFRRLDGASDGRARSELRRCALRAGAGGAARRRPAHRQPRGGGRREVLEYGGSRSGGAEDDQKPSIGVNMKRISSHLAAIAAILVIGASVAAAQAAKVNVTGKWAFNVETAAGSGTPTITFAQDGEK